MSKERIHDFYTLSEILRCPRTDNKLRFNYGDSVVRVAGSDIKYPIIDQIVDFMPDTRTRISMSYDKVASRYDAVLTKPKLVQRICKRIIWGVDDDNAYLQKAKYRFVPGIY